MQCSISKTLPDRFLRRQPTDLRIARAGVSRCLRSKVACQAQQQRQSEAVQERAHVQTKAAALTQLGPTRQDSSDLECIASGLDSVVCELPESSGQSSAPNTLSTQPQESSSLVSTLQLLAPFFFWGTSMVAMKGLPYPPLLLGAVRLIPAGALLVGVQAARGKEFLPRSPLGWAWVMAFALVDGAMFQGFLAEGLQHTTAGLGSVVIDANPLTVALLSSLLFGEVLTTAMSAGLALGVAGLLLLQLPDQSLTHLQQGLLNSSEASPLSIDTALGAAASGLSSITTWAGSQDGQGFLWMLAAAQAMAVGTVMVRAVVKHCDAISATGWHMLLGGACLLGLLYADDPSALATCLDELTGQQVASAAWVSLLGGAAAYALFFNAASKPGNLTQLSSLTFLTPVFAAAAGYLALGEVLTPQQLAGGSIVLLSVFFINSSRAQSSSKK